MATELLVANTQKGTVSRLKRSLSRPESSPARTFLSGPGRITNVRIKPLGLSPAEPLVRATVFLVLPDLFVSVLGIWEGLIGICLLYRPLIRLGLLLPFLQLPGTFLPMVVLPGVVFETFPYALTTEGQYIVKNLVIIGAALVGAARGVQDAKVPSPVSFSKFIPAPIN